MKKFDYEFFLRLAVIIWAVFIFVIFFMKFDLQKTEAKEVNTIEPVTQEVELIVENIEPELACEIENDIVEFEPYYSITDDDRYVIERIVAGEAGHEPLLGKIAVAQCILNAMRQDGLTASEVRETYQYFGWATENFEINYPEDWAEVQQAVWCVFDNGEKVTEENILWFYAPKYSSGSWHNTQKFVIEIGGHLFYAPWD